ncbi:hypothetical protein Taro_044483, partial [Colocasia esculenta]|nr:hypothetical protein [Colocasia esculenta]
VLLEELLELLLRVVVVAPAITSLYVHVATVTATLKMNIADTSSTLKRENTSLAGCRIFVRNTCNFTLQKQKFLNVGSTIGAWVVGQLTPALWNVPRVEINNPRHVFRLYRSELDHQEDYQILPAVSRQASDLWLSRVPLICFSIVEMHVPDRVLRQFGRVQPISGPVDPLDRVTRRGRGHIDWARYFTHFVHMWHRQRDYIIPPDEDIAGIGRVEYMSWYWSITRRYIGRPGFTYDMRYEPPDHIERNLVEDMKHLHMMATDGLQDDISDDTQSRFIAMQMYIDSVLSQVQRADSSTSHAGPSEPCAGTPQQPDDAGPS